MPSPTLTVYASQAANYLNIKSLLDLTCLTVANMIKGGSVMSIASLQQCTWVHQHGPTNGFARAQHIRLVVMPAGKTPEEIRKTFNIVVCYLACRPV